MGEEKILKVGLIALTKKQLRDKLKDWMNKSRNTLKPICNSCAKLDSNNSKLGSFESYTKGMTLIDKKVKDIVENGGKLENPVEHITFDYKCERGHGTTYDYRLKDYNKLKEELKPKTKSSK